MRRRVAVTGIGVLTALGEGRADTFKGLLDGRCGIGPIRAYDASSLRTRIAAELDGFAPERYATRRELRMTTHGDRLAIAGAALAMTDAGLSPGSTPYAPERSAVYAGGAKEISNPEHLLEGSLAARAEDGRADFALLGERATSAFHPLYYVEGLQSAALFHLSHAHGFKGANAYFHGAADSSATAVGRGYRSIARGESDVVLAGGFDDAASWWVMSKTDGLGLMSTRNYAPTEAYRPFGQGRDGFVPGEGAAFLVLEELTAARSRGAAVLAEIRGFAATRASSRLPAPDADGRPCAPDADGRALAAAVQQALREAELSPTDIDYVAAHGSATACGDLGEARALTRALGPAPDAVGSCVKPALGHLGAAAGALNAAVCALALESGAVPPTLNLTDPDPRCRALDWLPGHSRELPLRHTVSLARGLEGQQTALVLSTPTSGTPISSNPMSGNPMSNTPIGDRRTP